MAGLNKAQLRPARAVAWAWPQLGKNMNHSKSKPIKKSVPGHIVGGNDSFMIGNEEW